MSTKVLNKQQFMNFVSTLQDDDIILVSNELSGNVSVSKKKNEKKISFSYAADAFANEGDIRHWAFGETPAWSFTVCKDKDVSDGVRKILSEILK